MLARLAAICHVQNLNTLAPMATATMTDGHEFSPPLQRQALAQSCSEWHPGLRANRIPSLCHRNATSSHHPPCFPELHWSHPVGQTDIWQISKNLIPKRPQPIAVTCEAGTMTMMYLCSHSVRPGREELGDAGSVEASLWQAKSGSESCSSRSHYYGVEFMIHNWVLCRDLKTIKGFVCVSKTCAHSRTGRTSSKENILSGPTFKAKCEKSSTDLNMSG